MRAHAADEHHPHGRLLLELVDVHRLGLETLQGVELHRQQVVYKRTNVAAHVGDNGQAPGVHVIDHGIEPRPAHAVQWPGSE